MDPNSNLPPGVTWRDVDGGDEGAEEREARELEIADMLGDIEREDQGFQYQKETEHAQQGITRSQKSSLR